VNYERHDLPRQERSFDVPNGLVSLGAVEVLPFACDFGILMWPSSEVYFGPPS